MVEARIKPVITLPLNPKLKKLSSGSELKDVDGRHFNIQACSMQARQHTTDQGLVIRTEFYIIGP